MNRLVSVHTAVANQLERAAPWVLPSLARLVFAGVLLIYFWNSGLTKLGNGLSGIFNLSAGAYVQIFPKAMEAVGYNSAALGFGHRLVALAGTWAEFILPLLIILGLLTRLAALGMIGFVIVQSVVDIFGHGADAGTIGVWFDATSDAHILDQRAFWVFVLIYLVMRGAGPLSLDHMLSRAAMSRQQTA